MFEDIKKLRRLLKLQEQGEAQMRIEGFTPETLKDAIKRRQDEIVKNINAGGWILMFLIVIPLALTGIGISTGVSCAMSYSSVIIIFVFILPRITGRSY